MRLESLAILMYMDGYDLIAPMHIEFILNSQQEDGGWKLNSNYTESNDHSTLLGLWSLLQWRYRK